ncbi:hypothetical protein PR048_019054 [Dryococelus australis]|uniref:Uncharacterized protein n=1 Tax=Dryococelus australis TaxID=614101 RepID=A0ABQ9H2E8_9NEOP|nr:hypothetical protein PR048_019054 [Dryococelus australis]
MIAVHPDRADDIVKCMCLLHNVIIDKEGIKDWPQQTVTTRNVGANRRFVTVGENLRATRAQAIRHTLKAYFCVKNPQLYSCVYIIMRKIFGTRNFQQHHLSQLTAKIP